MMIAQSALHKVDCKIGDVDSNPAALEPLGNGRPAATEGIENYIALIAAGFDDAFEKCFGFSSTISR